MANFCLIVSRSKLNKDPNEKQSLQSITFPFSEWLDVDNLKWFVAQWKGSRHLIKDATRNRATGQVSRIETLISHVCKIKICIIQ